MVLLAVIMMMIMILKKKPKKNMKDMKYEEKNNLIAIVDLTVCK